MTELSDFQAKVLQAFDPKDTDIDVAVLYTRIYGDAGVMSSLDMQRKLGPMFKKVNSKFTKGVIELGFTRRTYRLNTSKG